MTQTKQDFIQHAGNLAEILHEAYNAAEDSEEYTPDTSQRQVLIDAADSLYWRSKELLADGRRATLRDAVASAVRVVVDGQVGAGTNATKYEQQESLQRTGSAIHEAIQDVRQTVSTGKNKKKRRRQASSEQFTKKQEQAYKLMNERGLTLSQAAEMWQPKPCTWQNVSKHLKRAEIKAKNMRSKSVDDYLGKNSKRTLPYEVTGQRYIED